MMSFINSIFTQVMMWCYRLVGNYGLAILLFTLLSKIVLLPLSIWVQKNSIKMVKLQPEINFLKVKHFGNPDAIAEGQQELFKREGYSPLLSTIPMIIQLILLMGVIEAIKSGMANPNIDMFFCGIDLSLVPSVAKGWTILAPIAAGLSAWVMCDAQNRANVLQSEQSFANKYGMLAFSVILSLVLGWIVTLGVVLYWIASNLLAVVQLYILNYFINPKNYVDYELLEESKKQLDTINNLGPKGNGKEARALRKREKEDYKRFFSVVNKHLVFYSEGDGFYKYYKGVIEYILQNTNIIIHYITSDPNDKIFILAESEPKIKPYYIGDKKLITLMMKMDADVVVMTMPDINTYHIKRSYVRDDIEYIYIPHCMDSINMTMRKGSIDNYDTIFCTGKHHLDEALKTEEVYGFKKRKMVKWGYSLLDDMIRDYEERIKDTSENGAKKTVLIAPSWQDDNIVDSCLDEVLRQLSNTDYNIVVRPHPQHVRHKRAVLEQLAKKFEANPNITIQLDFASNDTVFLADLMITDWSGITYEYAYTTKKPVVFINTPMKIMNPEYEKIGVTPINIWLRDEIGKSLNVDELDRLPDVVNELINNRDEYKQIISDFTNEYVYNIGCAGEVGGKYIISAVQNSIEKRKNKKS